MTDEKDTPEQEPEAEAAATDAGEATESTEGDPWAEAMAEQAAAGQAPEEDTSASADSGDNNQVFKPLQGDAVASSPRELDVIMNVPVRLNVELGRTRVSIKQLLELNQGSVVELDGLAGDPMDILINGYLIAQGEVVVVDDKYGIRITDIITPSERAEKLNR